MANFVRGLSTIHEQEERERASRGGGGKQFSPFCPEIQWTKDGEEKYVVFLNRADEMVAAYIHDFVPVGTYKSGKTKYERFIDRRDAAIGEDTDDLTDRLNHSAKKRTIGVVVELEPTYTTVNGRKRPTGFSVKTQTVTRRTEDGGDEEVEVPVVGVIYQAFQNFFGWVNSFNDSTAPIEETPLQIKRRGKDANTTYDFTPFLDQPIDYSPLYENIANIRYLADELEGVDLEDDSMESALLIGEKLLDKRLGELSDGDRYTELVSPIEEIENRFGGDEKARPVRAARPERPSPREKVEPQANGDSNGGGKKRNTAKFDELRKLHETA